MCIIRALPSPVFTGLVEPTSEQLSLPPTIVDAVALCGPRDRVGLRPGFHGANLFGLMPELVDAPSGQEIAGLGIFERIAGLT